MEVREKLVLFNDDDCIPAHGWIDPMWTAYCRQPVKTVAFTVQVLAPRSPKPTDYEKNIARLENAGFITANCTCSKSALLKVKGVDEDFSMAWPEDSALEFKLIRQQVPVHFIQQAAVAYPVRKAGRGISLKEQRKSMFNALLYKKHPLLYRQKIRSFLSVYRTLYGAVKFKTRFL